jgi:hypothetical protein
MSRRNPIVRHGTRKDFEGLPKIVDGFAVHFGSEKAARDRLEHTAKIGGAPRMLRADIRPKKSLIMKDVGTWSDASSILEWIDDAAPQIPDYREGFKKEIADALGTPQENRWLALRSQRFDWQERADPDSDVPDEENRRILAAIRRALLKRGYDSIKYRNLFEGKGTTSYAVIDESIIHPVKEKTLTNPGTPKVMTYAAAHRWETVAAAQGVSAVARSARGFMRAYQRAGTWSKLPEFWKRRRNAFVARHMAQVPMTGEDLWKVDRKTGKRVPSRRCLALIMWAFLPPGK